MKKRENNLLFRYKYDILALILFFLLLSYVFSIRNELEILINRDSFETFIRNFGIFGPIVIIMTTILEVIIAPIPGFFIAVTSGFLFGSIMGSVYVYIGNLAGSFLVFWLARRMGRPVVEKFIKKELINKYEKKVEKHKNKLLFFYFFPIIPIDILSAAFGFSDIKTKKFILITSLGFVFYSIIAANFGDYLARILFLS